jgi:hypothetical protein
MRSLSYQNIRNLIMHMPRALMLAASTYFVGFAASGAILINGGFEAPTVSGGLGMATYTMPLGAPNEFGWTLSSGSIDHLNSGYWQPSEGSHSIDLNGISRGTIFQDFASGVKGNYAVRFDLSANPDLGTRGDGLSNGLRTLEVFFGRASGALASLGTYSVDSGPRSINDMMWLTFTTSEIFIDDLNAIYRLQFSSLNEGVGATALDNVQLISGNVQIIAEPNTMALIGFGLTGILLRRRLKSAH